jgi:hypothetical protein
MFSRGSSVGDGAERCAMSTSFKLLISSTEKVLSDLRLIESENEEKLEERWRSGPTLIFPYLYWPNSCRNRPCRSINSEFSFFSSASR